MFLYENLALQATRPAVRLTHETLWERGLGSGVFSVGLERLPGGGDVRVGTWRKQWRGVDIWMAKDQHEGSYVPGGVSTGRLGRGRRSSSAGIQQVIWKE